MDKRNLFLAKEGVVARTVDDEGEPIMPTKDIDKRDRAEREKKEKLANPNFYVSPVRLSVRNLGLEVRHSFPYIHSLIGAASE